MKLIIYSRSAMKNIPEDLENLFDAIKKSELDFVVNSEFADVVESLTSIVIPPEQRYSTFEGQEAIAISYGGDGTFLDCIRLFGRFSIPVIGINSGQLGFLATVPKSEMEQAFARLHENKFTIERRVLLKVEGDFESEPEYPFAFNEFSIQKSGSTTISVKTFVNDDLVATYWGDGIILSTPAGSTGYSLSVGGPIVAPECGCMILAPNFSA